MECGCGKGFEELEVAPKFVKDVYAVQQKMADDIIESLEDVEYSLNDLVADRVMNAEWMALWTEDMVDAVYGNLEDVVEEAGTAAIESVTEGMTSKAAPLVAESTLFDLQTARAQAFILKETELIGKVATATHQKKIRQLLAKGIGDKLTTTQMAKRLREMKRYNKGVFSKGQAERIARTETSFARTAGQIEGWQQSGVVKGKEFLLAPDACVFCAAISKTWKGKNLALNKPLVKLGGKIKVGKRTMVINYRELQGPAIHPNCLCDLLPVIITGGA